LHIGMSIRAANLLVGRSNHLIKASMINKEVSENILVLVRVTLRIHCFSNQVCINCGLITIVKLHNILAFVKNGVGICQSNGVTIGVSFL
jgi:hypothetical protein